MSRKIKVLIIDDSAAVRQALSNVLDTDPEIEVIGVASDPFVAAKRLQENVPDVITLDVEMPRMDGITFLRKLMSQHPIPVVMCSSLTQEGSDYLMQALEAGAVDIIPKPRVGVVDGLADDAVRVCEVVKAAANARLGRFRPTTGAARSIPSLSATTKLSPDAMLPPPSFRSRGAPTDLVVCVGASTGGTEALREFLQELPASAPGIVIVQHMPEKFTAAFAKRLDGLCTVHVKEAADGDMVQQGHVLIAPGDRHMLLMRQGTRYYVSVKSGPLVSRHRPSVDVLFRSAAHCAGANAIGIIMTGMGDDGALGLLEMHQAGAHTIAQDEATSVVYGMPKEAVAKGGVSRVLPLEHIAREVLLLSQHALLMHG